MVTAAEKASRSTASAPPAGSLCASPARMIERAAAAHLLVQEPDGVILPVVGAERVRANELGKTICLVCFGHAHGPHLVQHHRHPSLSDLPSGFGSRKTAADDVNGLRLRHERRTCELGEIAKAALNPRLRQPSRGCGRDLGQSMMSSGHIAGVVARLAGAAHIRTHVVDGAGCRRPDFARQGATTVAVALHAAEAIINILRWDAVERGIVLGREARPFRRVVATGPAGLARRNCNRSRRGGHVPDPRLDADVPCRA